MATRASVLSQEHIKALNMIDIEFYCDKKYSAARKAWRAYLDARSKSPVTTEAELIQFGKDCENTLVALLVEIGVALGYDFDSTHIKQSIYKPQGHVADENYQQIIRIKLTEFFSGRISLPMDVKSFPISSEEIQEQKSLRELAIQFLKKKLTDAND
jgi:hypothetical protein